VHKIVFAPYRARKAVALVVYALCWHLRCTKFNPTFPRTGKFSTFPAVFNLVGLSNAHTKCMEALLVFKLVISTLFTPGVMRAKHTNAHTHSTETWGQMVFFTTTIRNPLIRANISG
jgi:hypothetical protein